ncbi:MAG: ComEC/Rec2 family competence protein [Phycisphaerales bacterium JB050]
MHLLNPDIPVSFPAWYLLGRSAVLVFITIALGMGLASALDYRFGAALVAIGALLILVGCIAGTTSTLAPHRRWAFLAALGLASAAWTVSRISHAPTDSLIRTLNDEPTMVRLEALVVDQPRSSVPSGALASAARYAPPSVRVRLDTRRVQHGNGQWAHASGGLYASISGVERVDFEAGDIIRVTGMASRMRQPGNPGAYDPHPSAMQGGIVGSLRVSDPTLIETVRRASGMTGWPSRSRSRMLDRIELAGEETGRSGSAALLSALLLGERSGSSMGELEDAFTRTGVGHFLAISGLHVGMVLLGVALLVRLTGDRPRIELAAIIAASILLLLFIPARPPVLRAVLIALAFALAQASGRSYDRLSVLALVASTLLIARPIDLFNPGFQLTFLVVAGLIVCAQPLRVWMFGTRPPTDELHGWTVVEHQLKDAAAVSVCASAISTPLVAMHFGVFSALAAPLSVLLSPLVALVLGIGYAALLIGSVLPSVADGLITAALQPAAWLAESVRWIDALPGVAIYLPSMHPAMTLATLITVVWWMFPSYTSERRRWLATGVVLAPVAYGVLVGPSLPRNQAMRLDMLDVGDGTTILLRSGRESILYDCGSRWLGIGQREIPRAVRALGAGRVETVVVSHADIDHFSGLIDAAQPLGVRRVIVTPHLIRQAEDHPQGAAALLLQRLGALGIRIESVSRGDTITLGSVPLEVLHPAPDDEFDQDNDSSIVLRATLMTDDHPTQLLLVGDIERDAMTLLESREPDLRADIVEVPHHGSARSFAYPFVEALDPKILLQSTGPSRVMDERWDDIREGRQWWTTATDGAITVIIGRDGSIRAHSQR